ncbi:helix-turn-helix domain-containing protein [Pedobacter frigoris]|uniref:AraC family transcriptional regulator n=1 Tax=Pedobacter frigoris TaxID=2571272 RepID=A0A4U1CIB2_9SPHI|nr:AraC family transcriptional regulator [Pedobacter frigoris]TKC06191.1 AraC family transcriptional regulator [Pedobacter frigoris]
MKKLKITTNNNGYHAFRVPVSSAYQQVFTHFYFAENNTCETITKTLLPSYQTVLIFSFGVVPSFNSGQNTQIEVEKCLIIGPIKHAFEYTLPPGAEILTVNFKDDAFYRFFGHATIAEHVPINPDELLNEDCFTVLWHELNKLDNTEDRVNYILKFSDRYLIYRDKVAEQLANFIQKSLNPIKAVADLNNQTERNIQLNHKKHFGYSAKELCRYQRFLKAIELIEILITSASKIDWFEIISECGYYDQSQLIHDFKHYINLSPSKYLKFQQDICNPMS